jgi:hypothetical protein
MTEIADPADPKKNGWGGIRSNSGGARPGSGRPKKPFVPGPVKAYAKFIGKNTPRGPVIPRVVVMPDGKIKQGITTSGALSQFERAWVYVGVRKDGLVKIGMSGNVSQRCAQLSIKQFFAHPVVPGLARMLESMALRRLGALKCGSEWVMCKPQDAAAAVVAARNELSKICHADPNETPIEAYNRRRSMAA